jgi:heme exporter protein C
MKPTFTIFALITLALLSYGLYQALVVAPTEATMGNVQRIFYYHVALAWTAMDLFLANFIASIIYLLRRKPAADALAYAFAAVGLVYATAFLITGMLWARPVWGIWWTWDARLTSALVLWLIYASYLMLRRYTTAGQNPVLASVLAIFGAVDVVFVYMAIRWFRTQHPQPVIGGGEGSGIDPRMFFALMVNVAAFHCLAGLLIALRYRLERVRQQVEEAHAMKAVGEAEARGVPR